MKLPAGVFLGKKQRTWGHRNLTVTLSAYDPARELPWHYHANLSYFLVLNGQHCDRSKRGDYDQPELSLVFHPTTEAHAGIVGPKGALGLNIEYEPEWLESHGLYERDLGGLRPLRSLFAGLHVLQFLGTVFQESDQARAEFENQALELLEPLVEMHGLAGSPPCPSWFRRAEDFIHAHFRTPITLRVCAREAGIHPVHLARVFRHRYGCSISEYLRGLRILAASRLVLQEDMSIAEAAHRSGFADHAHFTRSCSRRFGFSPRVLRVAKKNLGF